MTWLSDNGDIAHATLFVEQFLSRTAPSPDDQVSMVDLHRYVISFIGMNDEELCGRIADAIDDTASIGMSMDGIPGWVFLNSVIYEAVHAECGIAFCPIYPWEARPDDLPWLLLPSGGGVEVGYGDDDPWDASLWVMRFKEDTHD